MADSDLPPWMGWDQPRALKVLGGAAVLALMVCVFNAFTTPGVRYHGPRLHYVPFPTCLITDFPATFLHRLTV